MPLRPAAAFDHLLVADCSGVPATFIRRHGGAIRQGLRVPPSEWYVCGSDEA
jgi:hypothetical protein